METDETTETQAPKQSVGHSFAKFMLGGVAAFVADRATNVAYDRVLMSIRARKVR